MKMGDHTADYYRLRADHERALALAAQSPEQKKAHLSLAERYEELSRGLDAAL